MLMTSSEAAPGSAIVPGSEAKRKREDVLHWLCQPFPPSNAEIARLVGVDRATVGRYQKALLEKGVEFVKEDGRVRSGRRTKFEGVWERIEALKATNLRFGGREIWYILTTREGFKPEDLPSICRIDSYLSEKKLTVGHPVTGKTDTKAYHQEQVLAGLDRVGMDTVYPFATAKGTKIQLVDIRDWHTGAVYGEPFSYIADPHETPLDQRAFAGVYLRFCSHIGVPKVLVLDNGAGNVLAGGWLPEIARWAIQMGTVIEWEPYGRPWKSGAVERWHRDLQKWWAEIRPEIHTLQAGYEALRGRCLSISKFWPRDRLNNRPAASVLPIRDWPISGPDAGPIMGEPIGRMGCKSSGVVRMQRTVEQGGFVQLHGNDFFRVSDMLVGGYVRIDFLVRPGGEPGEGTVFDGKGNVVGTFRHYIECNRPSGESLTFDFKSVMFHSADDCRKPAFSQDVHNAQIERHMKRRRAKGVYAETESQPHF